MPATAVRSAIVGVLDAGTVRAFVGRRVAIDRRSLAAFRIALGLVVLLDIARRVRDLQTFYTDSGVLPRSLLATLHPGYGSASLHALSGSVAAQVLLFTLAAVAAVALLVGYRTRLAVFVSLLLLVSVQLRNPLILNSGDTLLRRLLFWSLFLPLGSRWAVDASGDGSERVVGPATVGLLAQVVVVYATNAVVKLRADVWLRGDAVRYAFELDHFTVLLGNVLAGWAPLLTLADWFWLALLVTSPLLILSTGRLRAALVGAFLAVHAGMVVTLQLGVFPLVSMASLLPLLPGGVWARVVSVVPVERLPTLDAAKTPLARRWPALSWLGRVGATVCLVVLLVTNAVGLGVVAAPSGTPEQVTDRSWDMFAPSPPVTTWWYVAPANLSSGDRVDAITGEAFDPGRPADVATRHPNERWRKFLADARREPRLRESLARYLCARWNRTHESRMLDVRLWHMAEPTDLDGPESVQRTELGRYRCGDL